MTFTKERIAQFIANPMENGLTRSEQMELARIALAALESRTDAEPVGCRAGCNHHDVRSDWIMFNRVKNAAFRAWSAASLSAMLQGAEPVQEQHESAGSACKCRNSEKVQVLQAGWVAVPVEPTAEMIEATFAGEMELQSVQHQMRNRERRTHYYRAMIAAAPDFREIPDSSTNNCRENAETSTNCPKCGGRGSYHCPQMLGTVECECTLPAAPQQEGK